MFEYFSVNIEVNAKKISRALYWNFECKNYIYCALLWLTYHNLCCTMDSSISTTLYLKLRLPIYVYRVCKRIVLCSFSYLGKIAELIQKWLSSIFFPDFFIPVSDLQLKFRSCFWLTCIVIKKINPKRNTFKFS